MSTPKARSTGTRRTRRGPGQWLLGLLLVLAIAASVIMAFTSEMNLLGSLAVIAALWAAVIGAILVTKFRRQADSAESKARDLKLVYELQLEREINARRQYELDVENQIRREVRAEASEDIGELKAQVESLRASLQMLIGDLPEQRTALAGERNPAYGSIESGYAASGGFGYGDPTRVDLDLSDLDLSDLDAGDSVRADQDFADSTAPPSGSMPTADPRDLTEVIPVVTDEVSPEDGHDHDERPTDQWDRGALDAKLATDAEPIEVQTVADETYAESTYAEATYIEDTGGDAEVVDPTSGRAAAEGAAHRRAGAHEAGGNAGRYWPFTGAGRDEPAPEVVSTGTAAPGTMTTEDTTTDNTTGTAATDEYLEEDADGDGAHAEGRSVAELLQRWQPASVGDQSRHRRRREG
ncbi:DUF6779 domain-containing protein [Williamsia sterculiae]|uniref:DUF6779 domain-containing protein n=1 Tax=Williamsia sterculiae TaxID=1344003 RepID=A0A1N7CRD9_9NOCA|nr:DUF6779 domain-containing protein [Williamsia sterculiae]SIR66206.1 hypothetical protein SAMN05445060_0317 [Williamsia sterculiae]